VKIYQERYIMKNTDWTQSCIYAIVVEIYWIAAMIGKSLSDIADANIAKLQARYPNGFEPERSLNRGTEE